MHPCDLFELRAVHVCLQHPNALVGWSLPTLTFCGDRCRYLKLPFAVGLAREGKLILLEIMTRVDKLAATNPSLYAQVGSRISHGDSIVSCPSTKRFRLGIVRVSDVVARLRRNLTLRLSV